MNNPIVRAALARGGISVPQLPLSRTLINDTSSGIVIGAQAPGFNVAVSGANPNRVYLLIQNNTSAKIAIGVGSPNALGLVLLPGGYYERELYAFTQQIYITLLAVSAVGDYISVEEGSSQS